MITEWNAPEILARIKRGAMVGVIGWIGIVEARAVQLITTPPKSGRIYRRRGVSHQASAPGEAPASDTGRLVNSRKITLDHDLVRARLSFATAYAKALEIGTKKMEPRPFARRALAETRDQGAAAVADGIRGALK